MKDQGGIFIIGLVLIVVLAGPTLMRIGTAAYSDFWKNFWTPFKDSEGTPFWEDGDNQTSSYDGFSSVQVTVHYEDGTSRSVEPPQYNLLPLAIYDSGGIVDYVDFTVSVTLETSGSAITGVTLDSWNKVTFWVDEDQNGILDPTYDLQKGQLRSAQNPTQTFNSWAHGESKDLFSDTLTADEIETLTASAGYPEGQGYWLQWAPAVSVTVEFEDGSTDSKISGGSEVEGAVLWNFGWEASEITSLVITVQRQPFYTP